MDRGWATLQSSDGTRRVRLRECPPIVVGDWLAADADGTLERLARRSLLVRRAAGDKDEPQEMAANVDVVVVTWALDTRVGTGRLRDMLVLARDSGASPVLALSKVDVAESVDGLLAELDGVLDGVEVVTTSAVTGEGIDRLQAIAAGRTVVLLGSSGAGKSTLTNVLLGAQTSGDGGGGTHRGRPPHHDQPRAAGAARRRRHHRHPRDPGRRRSGRTRRRTRPTSRFPDLDELAEECRFSDCTHRSTPGCALDRAVADGRADRRAGGTSTSTMSTSGRPRGRPLGRRAPAGPGPGPQAPPVSPGRQVVTVGTRASGGTAVRSWAARSAAPPARTGATRHPLLALHERQVEGHGERQAGEQADHEEDPRRPDAPTAPVDDGPQWQEYDVHDDVVLAEADEALGDGRSSMP